MQSGGTDDKHPSQLLGEHNVYRFVCRLSAAKHDIWGYQLRQVAAFHREITALVPARRAAALEPVKVLCQSRTPHDETRQDDDERWGAAVPDHRFLLRSLLAQRFQRIYGCCAARWQVSCRQSHHCQQ